MLDRRDFVRQLLIDRGDLLVVPGLGSATYDVAAAGDHPLNFYLWGAMGGTAMIGLGLALARPDRRVAVLTGDGDMLMGIGSLATIGVKQPRNLVIVVLDNAHYGETGMQPSATKSGIDLVAVSDLRNIYKASVERGERLPLSIVVGSNPIDYFAATMRIPPFCLERLWRSIERAGCRLRG